MGIEDFGLQDSAAFFASAVNKGRKESSPHKVGTVGALIVRTGFGDALY